MFQVAQPSDPVVLKILKRSVQFTVLALLLIGAVSSYRAYVQVRRLEVNVNNHMLQSGSIVSTVATGSGRAPITVTLELIQGTQSQTLDSFVVSDNGWAFFDQRTQTRTKTTTVTPALLATFHSGEATLRATAVGREQWTRLPPPTINEVAVQIQHE